MAYTNIDDPSAHFQTDLYTGTGSELAITNDGNSDLQPDWIWIKNRTDASTNHHAHDTSRGTTATLFVNKTDAEETQSQSVKSVQSDGFTLGTWDGNNISSKNFVAWQWKANGGTTTSVSASGTGSGCVNACTHQANTTAGFSIITYTGRDDQLNNGQHSLLKHGLGVVPTFIILKRRDATADWYVMGKKVTSASAYSNNEYLSLNDTDAINGNSYTGSVAPTSTDIYLGNELVNVASSTYLMYAFAEKQGYSKFGKYVGNSNDNGTFVYLGFKPRWLMIKSTQAGMSWDIIDTARSTSNVMDDYLTANTTDPQGTSSTKNIDFLSNGFKCRDDNNINFSDHTYIYMAFAENPFTTSTGVPCTAR